MAVQAFLDLRIGFRQIDKVVAHVIGTVPHGAASSIDTVLEQDRLARACAQAYIAGRLAA